MNLFRHDIGSLYLSPRFYRALAGSALLLVVAYFIPVLFPVGQVLLVVWALLVSADYVALYRYRVPVTLHRELPGRFSNGEENQVKVTVVNHYPFRLRLELVDELPFQFQYRDFRVTGVMESGTTQEFAYALRPVERGAYVFQDLHAFLRSPLGLVVRRFTRDAHLTVKVYPAFSRLREFEIQAHASYLTEAGFNKIRKIGHSLEFEQIREYVSGDDLRSVNWKASARKGALMVNSFVDERSQQVYCIIDKGRVMKMPFEGMTLLDYAINTTLMLSHVALVRQDRVGLVGFGSQVEYFLQSGRKATQMNTILESLYAQQSLFGESNYESLYALVRTRITQRSLLVLFTNFESLSALQRQLPYLVQIARNHLLLVVFFENTGLRQLIGEPAVDLESLYIRTIAEKFAYEKRLMVKELRKQGIRSILTPPRDLTVNTVNTYLELKARQAI